MRATEGVLVDEESPLATQGLANYLYSVALSKDRLLPIIEEHNLYPSRKTFGDQYAIDELRNFLDVEIGSNHFARDRDEGDPQRSVGITVHFSDFDPNLAFNVAQDLGNMLVQAEVERRINHARKISAIASSTVALVQEKLEKQTAALASAEVAIDKSTGDPTAALALAEARIAKKRLLVDLKETTMLLDQVTATEAATDLTRAAEGANQALQFEIVDVRRPTIIPGTSPVVYAIIGLFVFVILLPIVAIGIAALDTRLHHIEDVMRLGMPVVGHVPWFPGAQTGTLRERSRRAKHTA